MRLIAGTSKLPLPCMRPISLKTKPHHMQHSFIHHKLHTTPLPLTICNTAAESLEDELSSDSDIVDEWEGFRLTDRGYTPFEFLEFTNIPLKHEVSIWVNKPVNECYRVWENKLNWMEWFDMIDEVGFHEEKPSYISMYLWYRWATTPFLELYVTLERTEAQLDKYILEEPVEGLPLVAAVLFQQGNGGVDTAESEEGTTITLRISYLLPTILKEFAGTVAVYGDVNRKLEHSMSRMKAFVEDVDVDALEELRKEHDQEIKANFSQQIQNRTAMQERYEKRAAAWERAVQQAQQGTTLRTDDSVVDIDEGVVVDGVVAEGASDDGEVKKATRGRRTTKKKAVDGSAMTNPAAKSRTKKARKKSDEDA